VGEITLDWNTLTSDAGPEQQLIVYTAEPGSPSETVSPHPRVVGGKRARHIASVGELTVGASVGVA
jgi:hypothetical protein